MQEAGALQKWMPQAKKKQPKKKKALKVTWDDSSDSENEEANNKEEANFALMALGGEVCDLINEDLSFDELSIACMNYLISIELLVRSSIY